MLPQPNTAPKGRTFRRLDVGHRHKLESLLSRSRITNLSLALILCCFSLSLLINFQLWSASGLHLDARNLYAGATPVSIIDTILRPDDVVDLNHLVMVPGHAVWTGAQASDAAKEEFWLLEPYQKGGGRVSAFIQHIQKGVEIANEDVNSLLVFSGGQTRPASPDTEAISYLELALALGILTPSTQHRVTTENYALDSFQNLLFSIARFHEVTGQYPQQITVVGYEMKKRRFEELHRHAVRWPQHRWQYIGIDAEHGQDLTMAYAGERQNGYLPYSDDMYGCHDLLLSKRRRRNQSGRFHPYHTSSPEMWELLEWCPDEEQGGRNSLFSGQLPWLEI